MKVVQQFDMVYIWTHFSICHSFGNACWGTVATQSVLALHVSLYSQLHWIPMQHIVGRQHDV